MHGQPLCLSPAYVKALHESEDTGRHVVLTVDNVDVILSERRLAFTTLAQFTELGLDPLAYRIVCLKLGYLFPDFQRIAPEAIMALSPGAINALPETLPFHKIRRPMYPLRPRHGMVSLSLLAGYYRNVLRPAREIAYNRHTRALKPPPAQKVSCVAPGFAPPP